MMAVGVGDVGELSGGKFGFDETLSLKISWARQPEYRRSDITFDITFE